MNVAQCYGDSKLYMDGMGWDDKGRERGENETNLGGADVPLTLKILNLPRFDIVYTPTST